MMTVMVKMMVTVTVMMMVMRTARTEKRKAAAADCTITHFAEPLPLRLSALHSPSYLVPSAYVQEPAP
jgi:hypothetical protein